MIKFIDIPKECPICGGLTEIKLSDSGVKNLICTNSNCAGKLINRFDHFCGKKGLDIKGLSKATLEKLIEWGWLEDTLSLFKLSKYREEWIQKSGFGVKSVDKILAAIDTGRQCELHQFIAALGIPLIGSTAAKELEKHFETWDDFIYAINNDFKFYTLPNFGAEMHNQIVNFDYSEAEEIAASYIFFKAAEPEIVPAAAADLSGKTFVITGKLAKFKNRDEIKSLIESLGGKVSGSVSKNTNYLINNDVNSTSSKNMTAKSLGVPILSEEDFIQAFGISN